MPHDLGIGNRLRAAGCTVVEIAGWQTRGDDIFAPRGSVDHHTAGGAAGNAPSLGICINGRSDLPGPLCHVLVGRDLTCYLIAAGRANHAGSGGWRGMTGNSSVFGVERENVGTPAEPWRFEQTVHAATVHRALLDGRSAELCCRHAEWAPTRKIDTHSLSGATLRAMIAKPPEEDDMDAEQDARLKRVEDLLEYLVPRSPLWAMVQGSDIGKVVEAGTPGAKKVADLWRYALYVELERQGRKDDLVQRIAQATVAALPPGGGDGLSEAQMVAAVRQGVDAELGFLKPGT